MANTVNDRIAELVRSKLTSGNSVPVERCTIFAKEIKKIDDEFSEYAFAGTPSTAEEVLEVLKNVDALDAIHVDPNKRTGY